MKGEEQDKHSHEDRSTRGKSVKEIEGQDRLPAYSMIASPLTHSLSLS